MLMRHKIIEMKVLLSLFLMMAVINPVSFAEIPGEYEGVTETGTHIEKQVRPAGEDPDFPESFVEEHDNFVKEFRKSSNPPKEFHGADYVPSDSREIENTYIILGEYKSTKKYEDEDGYKGILKMTGKPKLIGTGSVQSLAKCEVKMNHVYEEDTDKVNISRCTVTLVELSKDGENISSSKKIIHDETLMGQKTTAPQKISINLSGSSMDYSIETYQIDHSKPNGRSGNVETKNFLASYSSGDIGEGDVNKYEIVYEGTVVKPATGTVIWKQEYDTKIINEVGIKASQGNGKNNVHKGDPVNIVTGYTYLTETDFSIPEIVGKLQIERNYNSSNKSIGLFGRGWTTIFDAKLEVINENEIKVAYPSGMTVIFKKDQAGRFRAPFYTNDTLEKNIDTYTLNKNGGSSVTYSKTGRLIGMSDRNGNKTILSYDGNNRIVTGPSGQRITLSVSKGKVVKATDQESREWLYEYDNDNLISITNPNNQTARFEYGTYGMERQYDFSGYLYTENKFDEAGRVIWQKGTHGNIFEFEYDLFSQTSKLIDHEKGTSETYHYNNLLQIEKHEFTDGTYETYEYDKNGNKTEIRRRDGIVINRLFDEDGNLVSETKADGVTHSYSYNSLNQITSHKVNDVLISEREYSNNGNLLIERQYLDTDKSIQTQYEYDGKGRLIKTIDPEGQATTFAYLSGPNPVTVTDHEKNMTELEYDNLNRLSIRKTIDGTTTFEYDDMNNVVKITDPSGAVIRQVYNEQNKIKKKILPEQYNSVSDDGPGYIFEYDGADRLVKTVDPAGNVNKVVLDSSGLLLKEVHPNFYNEESNDGLGMVYEYDQNNRLVRIIRPDGKISRVKYDLNGNVIKSIGFENYNPTTDDGPGMVYEYDSHDRLLKITDAKGVVIQKNVYDAMGYLVKQIDAAGYKTASNDMDRVGTVFTRNLAGWVTEVRTPISGSKSNPKYQVKQIEYYKTGLKKIERTGREEVAIDGLPNSWLEITYTYNSLGRVLTVSDNTGAQTSFDYDALGRLTHKTEKISDTETRVSGYTYNKKGLLETEWVEIEAKYLKGVESSKKSTKTYGYNDNGQLTSITSPEGERVDFVYDSAGRVIEERRNFTKAQVDVLSSSVWLKTPRELILPGTEAEFSLNIEPNRKMKTAEVVLNFDSKLLNYSTFPA